MMMTKDQARLLRFLELQGGRLLIAGIVECRAAIELERQGLVELPSEITPDGGSGVIYRTDEPLNAPSS